MTTTAAADPGYFQHLRQEMLAYVPATPGRLLDVGCGAGAFAAACKLRSGCETWGIERNPEAATVAAGHLDRVLTGDAQRLVTELPPAHFDVVVCNDVLEHLAEPEELLVALRRTLRRDGVVVASIPNIRYYKALKTIIVRRDFPRDDEGIFDRTHLRFFTQKAIVRMFAKSGYALERMDGINASRSRGLALLNLLCFGALDDMRFLQFACVARSAAAADSSTN